MVTSAILALADGTVFKGKGFGLPGVTETGEVVFNTSMTGYQEILTDPSYTRQLVTLTYPHIGNYGTNNEDFESADICAAAGSWPGPHTRFPQRRSLPRSRPRRR